MATTLTDRASAWSCHEVAWAVVAGELPRLSTYIAWSILARMRSGTRVCRRSLSLRCPSLS